MPRPPDRPWAMDTSEVAASLQADPIAGLTEGEAARRLLLRFEDSGPAFNPLAAPPPDLESPLGQRQLGGLGVHLVRALTASQRYARVGDRNVLELSLPLAG